jgi:hypothetical protein
MVRRVLVFLLILLALPLFSQSSNEPSKSSMTCFTDAELDQMETEAAKIVEDAVTEAVNEAVKPYVLEVKKLEREIFWWKVGFWSAVAAAAGSLIWAAAK